MLPDTPPPPPPKKNRLNLSLNLWVIIGLLLVVILAMLLLWRPWNSAPKATDRTISVTGQATIKAEPDEYVFNPSYEFQNIDKTAALDSLTKKSDEIVSALKKLGVQDKQIKTNAGGYSQGIDFPQVQGNIKTYTLNLTVTLDKKDVAQKAQDYLVTTAPTGALTPEVTFSETKRKQLESTARDEATKDARTKAEQLAKNAGFKLGQVKTFSEGQGFGGPVPLLNSTNSIKSADGGASNSLNLQPGQNDLSYSVSVVYFIK